MTLRSSTLFMIVALSSPYISIYSMEQEHDLFHHHGKLMEQQLQEIQLQEKQKSEQIKAIRPLSGKHQAFVIKNRYGLSSLYPKKTKIPSILNTRRNRKRWRHDYHKEELKRVLLSLSENSVY